MDVIVHESVARTPEQLVALPQRDTMLKFEIIGVQRFGKDAGIAPMGPVPVKLSRYFAVSTKIASPAAEYVLSIDGEIAGRGKRLVTAIVISLNAQSAASPRHPVRAKPS